MVKLFFDIFGKIPAYLELFGKWKVEKWHSRPNSVKKWPFCHSKLIFKQFQGDMVKDGQFLTEFGQERHFSTFHLPKSFKFEGIFPKKSKKFSSFLYWTPDLQIFFRLLLIAAISDLMAGPFLQGSWKTSRLTCRMWKTKKILRSVRFPPTLKIFEADTGLFSKNF